MKIPHSSTLQREFDVSMTPMIDVVFLLLIFFVCTASFQITESVLPSPLHGAAASDLSTEFVEPELERIIIALSWQGEQIGLTINAQPCRTPAKLSELLAALASVDRTLPVLLDIADEAPLGEAIDIYDRCRLAGFRKIQFIAEVR